MLANATVDGQTQKVVMKGCKNGYFYALDAATGRMLWYFDAPTIERTAAGAILDPTNKTEMVKPWANYPSVKPYIQNPCHSGGIESNPAYDPVNNVAIVVTYNCPMWVSVGPTIGGGVAYGSFGLDFSYVGPSLPWNTTIWAIDVNTGKPLWQYPIPDIGFRGGADVSGGLVIVPASDGNLRALDEKTGQLVMQRNIGAALCTEPAIGQDAGGHEELVFPVCNGNDVPGLPVNNGVMMALATTSAIANATVTSSVVVTSHAASGVPLAAFLAVAAVAVLFIAATGVLAARRTKRS
jgi:outer membrane protein assembly factor BamB